MSDLMIVPFHPSDQDDAKTLILAGLEEHWGRLDPALNPDLNNIAASYAGEVFLVARLAGVLVGTGALIRERAHVGRVVRMSVAQAERRTGIASRLLQSLTDQARLRGYTTLVLETTTTWDDARAFYMRHGFRRTHDADGDTHFVKAV